MSLALLLHVACLFCSVLLYVPPQALIGLPPLTPHVLSTGRMLQQINKALEPLMGEHNVAVAVSLQPTSVSTPPPSSFCPSPGAPRRDSCALPVSCNALSIPYCPCAWFRGWP